MAALNDISYHLRCRIVHERFMEMLENSAMAFKSRISLQQERFFAVGFPGFRQLQVKKRWAEEQKQTQFPWKLGSQDLLGYGKPSPEQSTVIEEVEGRPTRVTALLVTHTDQMARLKWLDSSSKFTSNSFARLCYMSLTLRLIYHLSTLVSLNRW